MFILALFGSKRSTKLLGYVADYCVTCRKITEFKVEEVTLAPRILFIPIGQSMLLGPFQTCACCQMESDAYMHRFKSISQMQAATLEQLAQETFPKVYEVFKARLEREARVQTGSESFNATERKKVFAEIFSNAAHYFKRRQRINGIRVLVSGLNPLNPTEEELRESLSHFRNGRHSLGSLRSAELLRLIQHKEISTDRY